MALVECLIVGRGMLKSAMPRSLMSDVFEAIVAAIFLDGGIEAASRFIKEHLEPEIRLAVMVITGEITNHRFSRFAQRELKGTRRSIG